MRETFVTEQARATAAIAGIQKYFSAMSTLLMAGVSYTPTQLVNDLQAYVRAIAALKALHAQLHDAVLGMKAQKGEVGSTLSALEAFVTNQFGNKSSQLGDFGFKPKSPRVVSAATRAAAAAKARATRAAKKAALAAVSKPAVATPPATGTTTKS